MRAVRGAAVRHTALSTSPPHRWAGLLNHKDVNTMRTAPQEHQSDDMALIPGDYKFNYNAASGGCAACCWIVMQ